MFRRSLSVWPTLLSAAALLTTAPVGAAPAAQAPTPPTARKATNPAKTPPKANGKVAAAAKQTVCTITVNSSDEKEVFRRFLPASKYNFVELVEKGRTDWLASSCQAATSCDVLVISGHFDGDNQFFSDRVDVDEYLTVSELERASCSKSCPSVFSKLKEVYLFGCNTLNPRAQSSLSSEAVRESVHAGRSTAAADRQLRSLDAAHGASSLDRMRQLFRGVPVIYGFASTAPLGPVAGSTLSRYFSSRGTAQLSSQIASGRPDAGLLRAFSVFSLATATGVNDTEPLAAARRDMCQFADDRIPLAAKLDFVHELAQRPTGDARRYLDRIQRLAASVDDIARADPEVARAFNSIAQDRTTRQRFLDGERSVNEAPLRVRLVNLGRDLGWLTEDERWQELALMLGEVQARKTIGVQEIDLACRLNEDHELEGAFARRVTPGSAADSVPHAAVRACLGSADGRAQTLEGLVSLKESDVQAAQAYLRRRPISDPVELRQLGTRIAQMPTGDAQVLALDVLGRHYVSDPELLKTLTRLYSQTSSATVQNAVAGVLIRADRRSLDQAALSRSLVAHRKQKGNGGEMVEALLAQMNLH